MEFDFDQENNRQGTGSLKYDGLKEFFGRSGLTPMWVADMDFRVPDCVIKAIKERADHGIFGYPLITSGFYNAITNWTGERHGLEVSKDWIVFCPGIVPALSISVMVFTDKGDKVLLQSPVYPPFFSAINDNNRVLVNNQLIEDNGKYSIDFDDLERKLSQGVKMMFFCNPHNPPGKVWNMQEVQHVAGLCRKYNVILISDEIHSDLIYPGYSHISAALGGAGSDNLVICMAPSKTFNLAGMASAFLIIPERKLRNKMKKMLENLHIHYGNIFGLIALQAAYEGGEDWLKALMDYLLVNRDTVLRFFRDDMPEIRHVVSEGTYLVWLDCRETGMSDSKLCKFFTEYAGIAMNPGPLFGPGGEGFYRMNIASPHYIVYKALNNIKKAWQKQFIKLK